MSLLTMPATSADAVVACARAAQQEWQRVPVRQRLRPLRTLRHLLATEHPSLCEAVARDIGKPVAETLGGDILPLAAACRFLERAAAGVLAPRRISRGYRPLWLWGQSDIVYHRPRGVVGIIGTWNYPLFLNGVQIAHAVAAGNGVVWKPSEVAPASAAALFGLIERAGFPSGLIGRLEATREGGPALVEAAVDHIVFTGGADTGRRLARRLGERLISSTLELSGCDALFVLDDADVDLAARAAWFGATLNRGQTCLAVRRAFVHRAVYAPFCETLRALAAGAAPLQLALSTAVDQAHRLVREAVAAGARLACEPPPSDPAQDRILPMAVLDARPEMALCREASFAPVLAVLAFDRLEEAVQMDRLCPYALGGSIFTRSPQQADALAAHLCSGAVTINDAIVPTAHPATPFGGRGDSGWGVTQGAEGLLEMTVPQVVSHRSGRFRPHFDLAAGRAAVAQDELLRGLLEAAHSPTLAGRWRGWREVFSAARRMAR